MKLRENRISEWVSLIPDSFFFSLYISSLLFFSDASQSFRPIHTNVLSFSIIKRLFNSFLYLHRLGFGCIGACSSHSPSNRISRTSTFRIMTINRCAGLSWGCDLPLPTGLVRTRVLDTQLLSRAQVGLTCFNCGQNCVCWQANGHSGSLIGLGLDSSIRVWLQWFNGHQVIYNMLLISWSLSP